MQNALRLLVIALVAVWWLPATTLAQTTEPGLTFVRQIGGPSHAQIYPAGHEVTPAGDLVVADIGNNQVVKFTPGGAEVWRVGTRGTGLGRFQAPRDVGVDAAGNIYIADALNKRIVKLGPSGAWITSWRGPSGDLMAVPLGVTVREGLVYVADTNHKIRVFTLTGTQVRVIVSSGSCVVSAPRDAAADSAGNVYIANYGKDNVLKMSSTGGCLAVWGSKGSANGQFKKPYGVTVGPDPVLGTEGVYVADANNGRIQEFRTTGTFVTKFGSTGFGDGRFNSLRRVALAADGDVWGADLWRWRLERFDRTSAGYAYASQIGAPLPAPTDSSVFHEVRGIAFGTSGNVVAMDTVHHRFALFTPTGSLIRVCGDRGGGVGQYNWPQGVAVDKQTGTFWVLDTKQGRIHLVEPNCTPVLMFGSLGSALNQMKNASSIAIRQADRIAWIADTSNNRIVSYDVAARSPIAVFGVLGSGTGNFRQPKGIAVSPINGHIFVADTLNDRVVELDDSGGRSINVVRTLTAGFNDPAGVAVDQVGRIFVADSLNSRVVVLSPTGTLLTTLQDGFVQPENVAVDETGLLYVADTYRDRIRVYRYA